MSDVVSFQTPRAYPLPKSVVEEVQQGLRWQRAYDTPVTSSASWMAKFLSAGGSVTADVVGILASVMQEPEDISRPGEIPNAARIEWALQGGNALKRWLAKMQAGMNVAREQTITAALESMDYSDDYIYLGIMDSQDETIVRSLVRVDKRDLTKWERWSPAQTWHGVAQDEIALYDAMELDKELAATTAAALVEVEGVIFRFGRPRAFLAEQPILAALEADDELPAGTRYYAIVDRTDTTAVMDLITISPGPIVKVRNAGKWNDSEQHLAKLRGIDPPPLVELTPDTLEMVLAQIDGTVQTAETDPNYVESLGNEDEIVEKQEEKAAESGPVAASIAALQMERDAQLAEIDSRIHGLRQNDASGRTTFEQLLASGRRSDEVYDAEAERREQFEEALTAAASQREETDRWYRRMILEQALAARAELRTRTAALETIVAAVPARAGASRTVSSQFMMKKYWLAGHGAVRMTWGCLRGDSVCQA